MESYICIKGKKITLTMEQVKELGFSVDSPLTDLVKEVRAGKRPLVPGKEIEDFGMKFKIIGYDHDVNAETPAAHTVTLMSLVLAPEHRMHSGPCPDGWAGAELRDWLNDGFFKTLPIDLRKLIRPTIRKSNDSRGNIHTATDKLFLPTESELFGSAIYSACECGDRYEAFVTSETRIVVDKDGDKRCYFTSSACAGNPAHFVLVSSYGLVDYSCAYSELRAPFCFQLS